MSFRAIVITELAFLAAFFALMGALRWYQPFSERAAYLEGRFGIDHHTALHYAFEEVK